MKPFRDPALAGALIHDGVKPIDIGDTIGIVAMAARVLPAVEATVIAKDSGRVRLAGELTAMADHALDTVPADDVAIVHNGFGWPAGPVGPAAPAGPDGRSPRQIRLYRIIWEPGRRTESRPSARAH